MSNETKKYASLENLQTFKENADNLYATQASLDELSSNVAYINEVNNENIETEEVSAIITTIDSALSEVSTNPAQNRVVTGEINRLSEDIGVIKKKTVDSHVAYVSSGYFISKTDGQIYTSASYGSTDFIPVNGGESVKLKGFYCYGNASVVTYDSNFAFIEAVITDEADAGEGKIITLNDNVAYIRATSTNTGSIVVDYIDRPVASRTIEDAPYDLGEITENCFVSKSNGEIQTNTTWFGVTDYVEIASRYLKIENPNLSGNAGICEYDENHNFISCVFSLAVTSGQYVVKLSPNAKYVRATVVHNNTYYLRLYPVSSMDDDSEVSDVVDAWLVATGNQIKTPYKKINALSPTITFIDDDTMRYDVVKRYHDIFANFGKSKNLYDKSAKTDGYRLTNGGINYEDASYSVSDYIAVYANTQYTFSRKGVAAANWLISRMAFYDSNKTFISDVASPVSPFTTPENAAYLRFSTSTERMEGTETDGYIQLEKGVSATAYEEYSAGLQGIKGCYGVITDYLDRDEELKNLLLEYEEEGFGMLFHAKWQDTYYMNGENRDIVASEKDYCKGIRRMREIGFIDYDYWVSPYGVTDAEITAMCKRHGAKCLLSTSNNTFIQSNGKNGKGEAVERYALPRCSMGYDDTQYPSFTLASLKAQVDKCVQTNGWLIVTTHVQQWADEYGTTPDERLSDLIQYALDAGCDVKTFAEAYAERNSILMMNDVC